MIDADGYLTIDGARVPAAHPGDARGTDCLTAHYWANGEWDCGCIDPVETAGTEPLEED